MEASAYISELLLDDCWTFSIETSISWCPFRKRSVPKQLESRFALTMSQIIHESWDTTLYSIVYQSKKMPLKAFFSWISIGMLVFLEGNMFQAGKSFQNWIVFRITFEPTSLNPPASFQNSWRFDSWEKACVQPGWDHSGLTKKWGVLLKVMKDCEFSINWFSLFLYKIVSFWFKSCQFTRLLFLQQSGCPFWRGCCL